ncbi:hypothetical protein B0T19DRAFT_446548 [Cercophora scortea]|uniref:SET domain-containing protein n=1 Tax=Cercophora scortea TaxID=314031 RepID=A0AAE0I3A3_9PEZI|nr:hypothetical protein B0T19DRAFT_446548 [Cercophora scortea]
MPVNHNAGFDMVPRLSASLEDKKLWRKFINHVKEKFKADVNLHVTEDYIEFDVGDRPKLPFEGHKFLRFSLIIGSDGTAAAVNGAYLAVIAGIAQEYFGMERLQGWNDELGTRGHYTAAEVHESILSYSQLDLPPPSVAPTSTTTTTTAPPFFQITILPTKGRALIAQTAIPKGTRILSERPLFTLSAHDPRDIITAIASALQSLPKPDQQGFLTLSNAHRIDTGLHPFLGTFITNSLPCDRDLYRGDPQRRPAPDTTGIFPTISLLNHSCVPNTVYAFNPRTRFGTVHALRAIPVGEELTMTYVPEDAARADRRDRLQGSFNFICACAACELPPAQLGASDARRTQIDVLRSSIENNPARETKDADVFQLRMLHNCYVLAQLLREEYGEAARLSWVYDMALRTCLKNEDLGRAGVLARRVYEALVVELGEDSQLAQEMRGLVPDPKGSQRWDMVSAHWRTTSEAVPEGLDGEEFERWLFKISEVGR